jgi:tetratricopeptide (TPR) repeat protein
MVNGTDSRPGYRNLYPLNAFGWWAGAELAQSENHVPRSIRSIERAEDLAPRNAEVHRVKGEIYGKTLDRPRQAVPELKRARELGIDRLRLVNSLAQAQYRSGQYPGAVDVYTTLRKQEGNTRPDILYNLGSAYLGAGEFERSEELVERAHNQGYRNQNSFNQWGLSLELQGERQRALAKYVEGIEWGERNNEPIGRVRENLNRALAQDPPTPRAEWLAPVEADLGFQPWATLDASMNSDIVPSR